MIKQVVIPVAGDATRMRPLTNNKPKCLIDVNGRPLISYTLDKIKEVGINEVILIIGHCKEQIINYFQTNYTDMDIKYVVQKERSGTAKAIALAEPYITDDFLVVNGDILFESDLLNILIAEHQKGELRILGEKVKDARPYGALEIQNGIITNIIEKSPDPPTNIINAGFYIYPMAIFDAIRKTELSPRGEYEITDSIKILINNGHAVRPIMYSGTRIELTIPDDVSRATSWIQQTF